jgi:glycogen debranching enzyme
VKREASREARVLEHGSSTLLADLNDTLTTKAGGVFCLCARDGDLDVGVNESHGLYFHDTRFLERATLRVDGQPLTVLLSSAVEDDRSVCELTNPDLELADGTVLPKERLSIRRERALGRQVVETIEVRNFDPEPVGCRLDLEFATSFDDMFVIRGAAVGKRGRLHRPAWTRGGLLLRYDGADKRTRTALIGFAPPPSAKGPGAVATYKLALEAGERATVRVTISLEDQGPGALETKPVSSRRGEASFATVSVKSDNELFDQVLARSFEDLRMLATRERGETFFAAGVPWFVCLFGRDSLVTALQTLAYDARVAADTLLLLAKYQGRRHDEWRDEEPGKILHELRVDEKANLNEVPQTPYYGTIDATPLFICLLAEYVRWTGDLALFHKLRGNVERALRWIDDVADHDGDGFVDYESRSSKGLANQGWKDSGNAITNQDGSPVVPPVALVEVQGAVYRAKLDAAWLHRLAGDAARARGLERAAETLRTRFQRAYWLPRRRFLAVALQQGGRPAASLASNQGQALWSGIVDPKHADAVAKRLLSTPMFSGWGIRTLAVGEAAFNPIDYQVGAVWPHDNSLIAAGLKRYGFDQEALRVFTAIYQAATRFPNYRLPEVFAGFARERYPEPVRYPVACSPQAWAAGALPFMLQTALGLTPDATRRELVIRRPALPDWLGEATVTGLQVGEASLDLHFRRSGTATHVKTSRQRGKLRVRVESQQR